MNGLTGAYTPTQMSEIRYLPVVTETEGLLDIVSGNLQLAYSVTQLVSSCSGRTCSEHSLNGLTPLEGIRSGFATMSSGALRITYLPYTTLTSMVNSTAKTWRLIIQMPPDKRFREVGVPMLACSSMMILLVVVHQNFVI